MFCCNQSHKQLGVKLSDLLFARGVQVAMAF